LGIVSGKLFATGIWNSSLEGGVRVGMKRRWSLILPICGLIYFALGTLHSERFNREMRRDGFPSRYYYWSFVRLDSDPLSRRPHPQRVVPSEDGSDGRVSWYPPYIWVEPGPLTETYFWAALPALAATLASVNGLARLGTNEVTSFFILMPLLASAWFYLVGWCFDLYRFKRRQRLQSAG
jgi:hypothetical protein